MRPGTLQGFEPVQVLVVAPDAETDLALQQIVADDQIQIATAESALAAIEHIGGHSVDIVLTNDILAGSNGVALLQTVRERWPDAFRVLIIDSAWPDVVMEAVSRGGVHKIIRRSDDLEKFRETIEDVLNDFLGTRRITADYDSITSVSQASQSVSQSVPSESRRPVATKGLVLVLLSTETTSSIYPLGERTIIGRHRTATVWIPNDEVSRHHATITKKRGGQHVLRDLGSRNGTRLNGIQVKRPTVLRPGDMIAIGNQVQLLFTIG